MNKLPLSKVIFIWFFVALFLVPILAPKDKFSLFNTYCNPSVRMFVALGKGTKEITLQQTPNNAIVL